VKLSEKRHLRADDGPGRHGPGSSLHHGGRRQETQALLPRGSWYRPMAPLGALSQAWTSAEASLPLGWQLSGLYRFDEDVGGP
jgi:hypothetical protein